MNEIVITSHDFRYKFLYLKSRGVLSNLAKQKISVENLFVLPQIIIKKKQ